MSRFSARITTFVFLMWLLTLGASALPAAYAQDGITPTPRPVTDNEVNQISKNLYCPVCENVPLDVCDTAACERWREQVRDLLAQGYTEDQIQQYFVDRFGPKTVGTPTDPMGQLLTVVLPFALIGVIGAVALFTLLRWRAQTITAPNSDIVHETPQDNYRARLEEELRKRD
jgi:cytochrome c-type biogenesis protein CcmH